ncbi:hypothetical protein WJX72_007056 [[Myrmecia] bisecta]|uniref:NADH dehydrogenase [ubiquinone] 1 beta subcomplex subunit 9 n=1 Tax=[Myrmecia] bisecta TaxID=41462 RepID=A0AAW1R7L9_9CHLO
MSLAANQHIRTVRLYRHTLKTILSWAVDRELWFSEVERVRAEFYKNSNVTDVNQRERLLVKGQEKLREFQHPDPYIVPYRPGGSLYARNPPIEKGLHQQLDFGREDFGH